MSAAHERALVAHPRALDRWANLVLCHRCDGVVLPGGPIIPLDQMHSALYEPQAPTVTDVTTPASSKKPSTKGAVAAMGAAAVCGLLLWAAMLGSVLLGPQTAAAARYMASTAALTFGSDNGFLHVCNPVHYNTVDNGNLPNACTSDDTLIEDQHVPACSWTYAGGKYDEVILQKQTWDGTRFVADNAGLVINTNDSLPFGSLTPGTVMRIVAYKVNAAYDNAAAATIRGRQLGSFTFKIVAAPSSTQGADNT